MALERLDDVTYAWIVGYETGHAHGRAHERELIDNELLRARAGRLVAALADYPPLAPQQLAREHAAREATRARLSARGRAV